MKTEVSCIGVFVVPQVASVETKEGALELRRASRIRVMTKMTFQSHEGSLDYSVTNVFIPQVFPSAIQSVGHIVGTGAATVNNAWSPLTKIIF